jgi:hypothetical protein
MKTQIRDSKQYFQQTRLLSLLAFHVPGTSVSETWGRDQVAPLTATIEAARQGERNQDERSEGEAANCL